MQAPQRHGGFDVDRVFGLDVLHFVARQQAKMLDVFVQVPELKLQRLVCLA